MNKKIAATGLILFSFILPSKASAASFSQLFIFGDSLSDAGNAYNGTLKQIPPSPPYFEGRFSNGNIWADYLGEQLNLKPTLLTSLTTTSPSQGINFAIAGSKSGQGNSLVPFLPLPGVLEQVKLLTNSLPNENTKLDSNALYAIWGGANDYINAGITDTNQTVNNLTSAVGLLTQAGAKNVMVLNLPDLGKTPQALNAGTSSNLSALTERHNTTLKSALLPFSSNTGLNIISVDVNNAFKEIFANPQAFGLNNVSQPCLTLFSVCNNPSDFLFFDNIHPTTKLHNLIAIEAFSAINSKSIPIAASVTIASASISTSIPEPSTNWAIIGTATLVSIGCLKHKLQRQSCYRQKMSKVLTFYLK
jgi:phospholipase/lecithinase/hemolysin